MIITLLITYLNVYIGNAMYFGHSFDIFTLPRFLLQVFLFQYVLISSNKHSINSFYFTSRFAIISKKKALNCQSLKESNQMWLILQRLFVLINAISLPYQHDYIYSCFLYVCVEGGDWVLVGDFFSKEWGFQSWLVKISHAISESEWLFLSWPSQWIIAVRDYHLFRKLKTAIKSDGYC